MDATRQGTADIGTQGRPSTSVGMEKKRWYAGLIAVRAGIAVAAVLFLGSFAG